MKINKSFFADSFHEISLPNIMQLIFFNCQTLIRADKNRQVKNDQYYFYRKLI